MTADVLGEAIRYVEHHGWSVFPINPKTKQPTLTSWKPYQTRRPTLEEMGRWWGEGNPHRWGVALVTGEISGVVVLDADHGPRRDTRGGITHTNLGLAEAEKIGALDQPTRIHRTRSGGAHFFFKHPGVKVPNGTSQVAPGLDVKADGGYVVLPPTPGYRVHADAEIAPFPDWLRPRPTPEIQPAPRHTYTGPGVGTPYGLKALDEEIANVRNAINGNRNAQLFRSAADVAELVAGGEIDEGHVRAVLRDAAYAVGLDQDPNCGPRGIAATIESGFKRGVLQPRSASSSTSVVIEEDFDDEEHDPPAPLGPAIPSTGFLADYLGFVSDMTMAPLEFHLGTALFVLGAVAAPHYRIRQSGHRFPVPPWPVLLARSGGLKSSALKVGTSLLDEATGGRLRLPRPGSTEAFHMALQKNPVGYLEFSEFGELMAKTTREYMKGFREDASTLFDGDDLIVALKSGGVTVRNPALSIVGATVIDSISSWIREADLLQGFLGRFLFVPSESPTVYSSGLGASSLVGPGRARLVRWIQDATARPINGSGADVVISPEAEEAFAAYDRPVREQWVDENLESLKARVGLTALKLGFLYAFSESRDVMEVKDITRGIAFVDFCRSRIWPIIERNPGLVYEQRLVARLRGIIDRMSARSDDGWIRVRVVQRTFGGKARTFRELLDTLLEMEEVETDVVKVEVGNGGVREFPVVRARRKR